MKALVFSLLFSSLFSFGAFFASQETQRQEDPQQQIAKLVTQLGNPSSKVREEASRQLKGKDDAIPPLVMALGSKDAEVRRRAQDILDTIRGRRLKDTMRRLLTDWKNLGVDEIIDQVVSLKLRDNDCWGNAFDLAYSLAEPPAKAAESNLFIERKRLLASPLTTAETLKEPIDKPRFWSGRRVIAHTCHVPGTPIYFLIFCRGEFRGESDISRTILYANGDVTLKEDCYHSIVLCDGDVEMRTGYASVIFATGKITIKGKIDKSHQCAFIEGVKNFPPNLILFDTAKAGVEVSMIPGGVRVDKIHPGKAFAWAGIQQGDVLKAVDKRKIDSMNDFRRAVRRAFVEQQRITIQLERSGKILVVPVIF